MARRRKRLLRVIDALFGDDETPSPQQVMKNLEAQNIEPQSFIDRLAEQNAELAKRLQSYFEEGTHRATAESKQDFAALRKLWTVELEKDRELAKRRWLVGLLVAVVLAIAGTAIAVIIAVVSNNDDGSKDTDSEAVTMSTPTSTSTTAATVSVDQVDDTQYWHTWQSQRYGDCYRLLVERQGLTPGDPIPEDAGGTQLAAWQRKSVELFDAVHKDDNEVVFDFVQELAASVLHSAPGPSHSEFVPEPCIPLIAEAPPSLPNTSTYESFRNAGLQESATLFDLVEQWGVTDPDA